MAPPELRSVPSSLNRHGAKCRGCGARLRQRSHGAELCLPRPSAPRLPRLLALKPPRRGRRPHLGGGRRAMSQGRAGRPVQLLERHRPSRPGQGRMGVTLMSTALAVPPTA
jgi:hypothetical protein